MIKDKSLKLIFIVSLITAITFPLVSILYINPSFTRMLIHYTEEDALRTGRYLSEILLTNDEILSSKSITDRFLNESGSLTTHFNLTKIKIFDPAGTVLFSTDRDEIGTVNTKPYFHEIVARGEPYTKSIKKNEKSLEDQAVVADIVETYVPVMNNGKFAGAFELYYNVTDRNLELKRNVFLSSIIPIALMCIFLTVIVTVLVRAGRTEAESVELKTTVIHRSPFHAMAIITLVIILSEIIVFIMMQGISAPQGIVLDMLIMILLITPSIYFLLVQPLLRYISEHHRMNTSLIQKHNELNALFREVEIANRERQNIMDALGDMIILTDQHGIIKRVNRAVTAFTGQGTEEILCSTWEDMLQQNNLDAMTLHAETTELVHTPTNRWFALNAYPFEDAELNFSGTVITIHDTTEIRKMTEMLEKTNMEIEENRRKLQHALSEASGLIEGVIRSKDHSIRFKNPNIRKCYEVKNCDKTDCQCHGKEAMRCWKVAGTYCGGETQGAFAQKYGDCSVCEVYKKATTDPIYQIGEHFNNMMHILEVKNCELENAYDELKATQSQILQKEKMASIGSLAAGVAHEINNPMGFISSNLSTLKKYANKLTDFIQAQTEAIEAIHAHKTTKALMEKRKKLKLDYVIEDLPSLVEESLEGAERVKKIVQNLKTFSRIDEAENKPADINECIESTLNIVWNEIKYNATVEKEYGELPLTTCNPQQLNQVFMNLLVNAAHSIEKQGEIKIKTWNGDGAIHISISDSGSGMPEDMINRIFEPFFTTKAVGKGTGLGLSISYDIIKNHGGEIHVRSKVGKGTTFSITLPVVEEG